MELFRPFAVGASLEQRFLRASPTTHSSDRFFAVIRKFDPAALAGIIYILVTGMLDATLYHLEHLIYLMISMACLLSSHSLPEEPAKKLAIPVPIIITGMALLAVVHMQTLSYRIRIVLVLSDPIKHGSSRTPSNIYTDKLRIGEAEVYLPIKHPK